MTNCLRSISFHLNFHPKFVAFGSSRNFAVNRCGHRFGIPRAQPSPYEYAEGSQCSSLVVQSSKCLIPLPLQATSLTPLPDYYNYDPLLNQMVVKPLPVTVDDIVLRNSSWIDSSNSCEHLLEQDLPSDVIQRQKFPINVLMESFPNSVVNQIASFHRHCLPLTEFETSMILTADASNAQHQSPQSPSQNPGKASDKQLTGVFNILSHTIPNFFLKPQNYRIFHKNLMFQNNIRGVTTYGLPAYIQQMALLRLIGHLKFAYVKMEVLKMTKHPEDGTIRVRWRIRGVSGLRIFLQFWKFRMWQYSELMKKESDWYDGFSTFYVGSDGLVHKHVCDKMIPDNDKVESRKTNLAAKLAFLLGAIPRPSMEDLAAVSLALVQLQHQPTHYMEKD